MRMPRIVACVLIVLVACRPIDELRERMRGATPHEDYVEALRTAKLLETALGRDWLAAAEAGLRAPLDASVPVVESGWLDAERPRAVTLRLELQRGQRVGIDVAFEPDTGALVFIDVFRVAGDTVRPAHVAAADSGSKTLIFEPPRTGAYIVRVQPELLRGGRYTLTVRSGPSFAFPVHGVGERAIGSRFGAARDGGAREHHGIDIFAPRGTPVIAATHATVSRVRETAIGGRVVWLRDTERNQSIYYAHLDTQHVADGARVTPGDTLGTVGNTGNARTTPPHLHFGIYRRGEGPIDPYHFVRTPSQQPPRLRADTMLFGRWARTSGSAALRTAAAADAAAADLEPNTAVRVRGGAGDFYRVELPDGATGWIAVNSIRDAAMPLHATNVAAACPLLDQPAFGAALRAELPAGSSIEVIGAYGGYALVRADSISGWADCGV